LRSENGHGLRVSEKGSGLGRIVWIEEKDNAVGDRRSLHRVSATSSTTMTTTRRFRSMTGRTCQQIRDGPHSTNIRKSVLVGN
jgi:hypothetical protein